MFSTWIYTISIFALDVVSKRKSILKKGGAAVTNEEGGIKYLNINVSNSEVERNPDIVRLCSDVGMLEYVKPQKRSGKE